MIQDISPKELHTEYMQKKAEPGDTVFVFKGRTVLLREEAGGFVLPHRRDFLESAVTPVPDDKFHYLFRIDDENCFLLLQQNEISLPGYTYRKLAEIRQGRRVMAFAGATAYHLYEWYRENRYCGRCGNRFRFSDAERALICPICGNIAYPKIAPAVIVAVTDGDRILMSRYAGREYTAHALIAGFCEIGETAEQTAAREVMEETGLHIKNIRYYKSQPWGFDQNLLLGYFAELDGSDRITIDKNELSAAEWIRRPEITETDDGISLTREMMMRFRES